MKGRAAVQQGDYKTACPLFAESSRLDIKVGTLLNLADCEEHVGQLAEALQHWQQAVQLGKATQDRRTTEARSRIAALEGRVPRLTVRLSSNTPTSAIVTRDGVALGGPTLGVPLPLNPGEHVVEVQASGHEPKKFNITLAEGESKQLEVSVGPALPTPAPEPVIPTSPSQPGPAPETDNTLAYVFGGIGVAGVVVGSITGAMLINKNRTIDAQCNENNQCSDKGLAAVDDAKGLVPISNVAWIVGVVGLGAGTYLLVTSGPSTPEESQQAITRPRGIGIQLSGEL